MRMRNTDSYIVETSQEPLQLFKASLPVLPSRISAGYVEIVAVSNGGGNDDLIPEKVKSRKCSPESKYRNMLANLFSCSGCNY